MRMPRYATAAIIAYIVFGFFLIGQGIFSDSRALAQDSNGDPTRPRRECTLPDVDDIASMEAEAYWHPLGCRDIPRFDVPKEFYEDVLKRFARSLTDENAAEGLESYEIGTIRINRKHGGCVRICWFMDGVKTRLRFSYAGHRYVHVGERFAEDENLSMYAYFATLYDSLQVERGKLQN